ncbi:FtsX-like permease family protein [Acrocarpospora catenulata]|uniref:FtsX-like permease family protein n=1 Tax=Acrocarpospora catenulata TaxID=2836182 RepID=UPI001BDAAFF0|nr:FtsX-like permease family protein [Acrocarpospora catenulata]
MNAVLRLSRRGLWRARWRSLLILAMIALPVAAACGLVTLLATRDIDPQESVFGRLGTADALIMTAEFAAPVRQDASGREYLFEPEIIGTPPSPTWTAADIAAATGGRAVPVTQGMRAAETAQGYAWLWALEMDAGDPLTRGIYRLTSGRMPRAAGEVAVLPELAHLAPVGTRLRLIAPDREMTVVGVASVAFQRGVPVKLIGWPGDLLDTAADQPFWLVDTPGPVDWAQVLRLNERGLVVSSRAVAENPPVLPPVYPSRPGWEPAVPLGLGIVLVVLEVVLLAGPAFAVGLRRRRHELALLAAQGASPGRLRAVLVADGLTLGVLGALAGVPLGILGAAAAVAYGTPLIASEFDPFDVPWWQVAGISVLAVVSGALAALAPAVSAGRTEVAAALAGRRGAQDRRPRRPILGWALLAAGIAIMAVGVWTTMVTVFTGGVVALLGLVALTPGLVTLTARFGARLPLPLRLAARDAARNRSRTAPAVAAVLAALAVMTPLAVLAASLDTVQRQTYRAAFQPGTLVVAAQNLTPELWDRVRATVAAEFPGVPVVEADSVGLSPGRPPWVDQMSLRWDCHQCAFTFTALGQVVSGGPELLRLLLGREDPAAERALADGKAVVLTAGAVQDGKARFSVPSQAPGADPRHADVPMRDLELPAVQVIPPDREPVLAVVPPSAVADLKLFAQPVGLLVAPPVTFAQKDRLAALLHAVSPQISVEVGGERGDGAALELTVIATAAALLALAATLVATALAAADARPDLDTMTAIGASPRVRRIAVAGQAAFVAGLGTLAGVAAGLIGGIAFVGSTVVTLNQGERNNFAFGEIFTVPWVLCAGAVVVLPLLAAVIAGLFTPVRTRPVRRLT